MTPITEKEVAFIRHFMGYDLSRSPEGYQLAGVRPREAPEIMVDSSLELIADSLKILGRVLGNSSSAPLPSNEEHIFPAISEFLNPAIPAKYGLYARCE